jgi:hypothetical protein
MSAGDANGGEIRDMWPGGDRKTQAKSKILQIHGVAAPRRSTPLAILLNPAPSTLDYLEGLRVFSALCFADGIVSLK